jgi:hypothetical protein
VKSENFNFVESSGPIQACNGTALLLPVWNWFHVTVIEPNICESLVWNWFHVTVIQPNICGSLAWNWLHITVNIKTNFQEIGLDLDWIDLAGDRGKGRTF